MWYKMNLFWRRALKLIWVGACVTVLVWAFIHCSQQTDLMLRGECSLLVSGVMALFSLPLGVLWFWLVSALGFGLSSLGIASDRSSFIIDFAIWLGFFVVGYLQWFKLLPYLIQKWKGRK